MPDNFTGPVLYVERFTGTQGRILEVGSENDRVRVRVHWFTPGAEASWIDLNVLKIIPADQVGRCPNGQTGDECGMGENQCELCLADEDAEAEAIEASMGLHSEQPASEHVHAGCGLDCTRTDNDTGQPAPEPDSALVSLLARFERVWDCEVFRTGYHSGATCTPDDPHGGWNCGYVWKFPLLTDKGAREIGLITDTTKEN